MLQPRERSIGWIVAPSYDLSDRVFRLVVEIVETHLKHRIRTLSAREQRIVLTNFGGGTSEVRGKSADRPASLLGEGLDWLVVDEAAQLDREVWDVHLSQRLIDRNGWALLMSTPKGPGWFYRMYRRGQGGRDASYESWSSPSTINPFLDASAIEAERARLPADVFRQEYLGEFVNTASEPCDLCKGPRRGAMGSQRSYEALRKVLGVSKRSVVKRAVKEKWRDRLAAIEQQAQVKTDARAAETLEAMKSRHLKTIHAVMARALETLRSMPLDNAMDAVRAVDLAMKQERLIRGADSEDAAGRSMAETTRQEMEKFLRVGAPNPGDPKDY